MPIRIGSDTHFLRLFWAAATCSSAQFATARLTGLEIADRRLAINSKKQLNESIQSIARQNLLFFF